MKSTVTSRGQTVVPAKIRFTYGIEPQTRLEWIDDGSCLRVVPLPVDPVGSLRGKSAGLTDLLLSEREHERERETQPPARADALSDR